MEKAREVEWVDTLKAMGMCRFGGEDEGGVPVEVPIATPGAVPVLLLRTVLLSCSIAVPGRCCPKKPLLLFGKEADKELYSSSPLL